MATNNTPPSMPWMDSAQPMQAWWHQYCLLSVMPMVRLQIAWLENVTQTMQMEAQLFQALAKSGEKLTLCLTDNPNYCNAAELTEHYHKMVKTLTDANMERLTNVSQLSHEFRRCLWEEI